MFIDTRTHQVFPCFASDESWNKQNHDRINTMILLPLCILGCVNLQRPATEQNNQKTDYARLFANSPEYMADGFDFPVGAPNAKGYRDAQPFGENNHSGEDWNGNNGGNSDLGDPIYAIANGWVSEAEDKGGGWCNVMRVIHLVEGSYVESLYAHNNTMLKKRGDWVHRGEQIATIGTCSDYYAHLHFELRTKPGLPLGNGYSSQNEGLISPTAYIRSHRPKR